MNKEYWLNRIKTDNNGEPTWISRSLWYPLRVSLEIVEKDDINGMVR
jgi:hypothetical protein